MRNIKLRVIKNFFDFLSLEKDWEMLYTIDPHAQIFLSWSWMVNILKFSENQWVVVDLYDCEEPQKQIAFFPLTRMRNYTGLVKILKTAGTPYIDHTGMLCHPNYEEDVICILTEFLSKWSYWDKIYAWDVFDPRLVKALKRITHKKEITIENQQPTICPFIQLPSNWDTYENEFLKKNSRYNYDRKRKKLENLDGFKTIKANSTNHEYAVDTLLSLWGDRYDLKKTDIFRKYLIDFQNPDLMDLQVTQVNDTPIAAACGFIDPIKHSYSLYLIGFNPSFSQFSPGKLIILDCIKTAIENQCVYFDFLRGAYDFKYSFGAENRTNENLIISRHRIPNPLRRVSAKEYSF